MKYRIKVFETLDGNRHYYPQVRKKLIWRYIMTGVWFEYKLKFDTVIEARNYIKKIQAEEAKTRVISSYNLWVP